MKAAERRIAVNTILLSGTELISRVISLFLVILVARRLGPQMMGIYAFALTFIGLFETCINFGLDRFIQREVGRRQDLAAPLYATVFQLKSLIFLLSIGVVLILSLTVVDSGIKRWVVTILSISLFFRTNVASGNAFFRACQKSGYEALVVMSFRVVYGCAGLAAILSGQGLITLVSLELIAQAGACCLSWWLFFKKIAKRGRLYSTLLTHFRPNRDAESCQSKTWENILELSRAAKDFFLIRLVLAGFTSVNMLMLPALAGDTATGFYSAALRLISAFDFLPGAFTGAFLPVLSQCTTRSLPVFIATFRPYFKYLLISGLCLAALLGGIADSFIIVVYGSAFKPAVLTTALLALVLLLDFTNLSFANALIAHNQERRNLRIFGIALLANVLLNLALIPAYQQNGAVTASLVCEVAVLMLQLRALEWDRTVCLELVGTASRPVLAGALGFLLGKGLTAWQVSPFVNFLVMPPALLLLLALTGALSTNEFKAITSLVNFRKQRVEPI
ncbi:MAG: oligosaccharide flippase family protein [Anaerolineaceae bacterium]